MIAYTISWQQPTERQFDISISFTAASDEPRLLLPAWRPGRYLIQNYAANVTRWSAADRGGERREMWKDGKSSWRVDARAGEDVNVRYRYYAGVLDAGSSFLDEKEAYFNGSNLFMMVEGLRGENARLSVGAPAEWRIETQLRREDENTFLARDYDHLVDSPVIAAPSLTRHSFSEGEAMIHLIFVNDERIDTEQYIDPIRAIVRTQAALFGGLPLREYRFLIHIGDQWHGVEHEASCSIVAKRSDLLGTRKGDTGYDHFLSICSHEFFHLWNVKRILPSAFAPYDYSQETLTRLLWVMEGLTSYYGDLTLACAGLWDEMRYLKHLATEIETLENQPGREHLSLSQASFDSWLQSSVHDRPNALISFYNKGEIVSALLDLLILRESGGAKSLDDVMRILWRAGKPLDEAGFERAVASVCDAGDFFDRYVHGTDPLPYEELLGTAGVCIEWSPQQTEPSLGATLRSDDGRLTVVSALRGGAAMNAGLLAGDEIVAIDGTRTITDSDVATVLRSVDAGTPVEMLVARRGVIRTMTLAASSDPRVKIALRTTGDSALRARWLRRTNG
ncbi:MAG TPA: PDZ domain-containing protein [Thermoanaerobaculia bacterium]|nr:PDZ domain-containing protein [Thermoanaerobaculia bacterium]